jgi:hypothetical protein
VSNGVCPHKKWHIDNHNVGTCANPECGEVRQFPLNAGDPVIVLKKSKLNEGEKTLATEPRKKRKTSVVDRYERSRYYGENKKLIIADLLSIGRTRTREKWGIPNSSLQALIKKWLTDDQKRQLLCAGLPDPSANDGRLPAFPEFSTTWDPMVQIKWLEIYEKLFDKHSSENSRIGG